MKKKIIIVLSLLFIVIISIVFLFFKENKRSFYLENNYYGSNKIIEIKFDELMELIEKKESFAVFIYQPMCVTSSDFESVLSEFLKENKISIYKIAFSSIKDTDIGDVIEYYPSFMIYHEGKLIDFLEADKNDDVAYYTSKEDFQKWFTQYVKIKTSFSNETKTTKNLPVKDENSIRDVKLENVVKEKNKVNIYFFYGKGCPHCEKEFEFLESIKDTYGEYYNLYPFETWYNEENAKLIYTFAESMGDKVTGIPYTIIGNQSFKGFGESSKSQFITAIESQHKGNYDVYFDKIKNN